MEIFNQSNSLSAQEFMDKFISDSSYDIFSPEKRAELVELLKEIPAECSGYRDIIILLVSCGILDKIYAIKNAYDSEQSEVLSECVTILIGHFGIAEQYAVKIVVLIKNSLGIAAEPKNFDAGEFIDSRDGEVYRTTRIGNQLWLAENFKFEVEKGCFVYKDDYSDFYEKGNLYTYEAAMAAVPKGWRLPTRADFLGLIKKSLKSKPKNEGGWVSGNSKSDAKETVSLRDILACQKWNGCDSVGFAADCCGYRYGTGYFGAGNVAVFWSSTEEENHAYALSISDYGVKIECNLKECAYPIRLVKDL